MKSKRQIAGNKLFCLYIIAALFLIWVTVLSIESGDDIALSVTVGVLSLVPVTAAMFTPFCYLFDSDGVSLCYVLLPNERYLWKNVRAITVEYNRLPRKAFIFEFFCAWVFEIDGENEGELRFYMNGRIQKSFRTKYLLEKYWDGTITGYLFEDTKKWFDKRRRKKQAQIKAHIKDEILPMEREIRARTREWLEPLANEVKQRGLELRTQYIYITNDLEELKSRPESGYTYTLVVEIGRLGEKNDGSTVDISVDLLYVRLGKTSYKGVENKNAEQNLKDYIEETLKEFS